MVRVSSIIQKKKRSSVYNAQVKTTKSQDPRYLSETATLSREMQPNLAYEHVGLPEEPIYEETA